LAGEAKNHRENEPDQAAARKTVPEIVHVGCSFYLPAFPLPARPASLEHVREMQKSRRDAAVPSLQGQRRGRQRPERKSGAAD